MAAKKTVDLWMSELDSSLLPIARALRTLVLDAEPDLKESIKWENPVYEKNGRVCYLATNKNYVTLGLFNGALLQDADGLIEGTGAKMRHVKVSKIDDVQPDLFVRWIRESVALNSNDN